jgi:hypothetical protein
MPEEITFITDQLEGEPDILSPSKHEDLQIKHTDADNCETITKVIKAPKNGWTHELLVGIDQSDWGVEFIGDALLGTSWVGSTEV